jgi:hypothetical protein
MGLFNIGLPSPTKLSINSQTPGGQLVAVMVLPAGTYDVKLTVTAELETPTSTNPAHKTTISASTLWKQMFLVFIDNDRDGLADRLENELALKFAPEVRLPPDSKDWTRPANVDWFLSRATMRFEHNNCSDHQVLPRGTVTQANVAQQKHPRSKGPADFSRCQHTDNQDYSNKDIGFFLQLTNEDHKGAPSSQWRTYAHVKRSKLIPAGIDIQYWFFYAYNDWIGAMNHEGDWEHMTVTILPDGNFHSAWYAQHNDGQRYMPGQLAFVNGTHPVVYSADGSHASYPTAGKHFISGTVVFEDYTYNGGPQWRTWDNLINVGEKSYPLNGQTFIQYSGRWGEIGQTKHTSGPTGPAFQDAWNKY